MGTPIRAGLVTLHRYRAWSGAGVAPLTTTKGQTMTRVIAYTYRADIYCNSCIVDMLPTGDDEQFDGWALADGVAMSTEANLDEIASAFGIDRYDESTFDSGDFPKVVFSHQTDGSEYCGACHGEING